MALPRFDGFGEPGEGFAEGRGLSLANRVCGSGRARCHAAPPGSHTVRLNLPVTVAAERAFPAAVAELRHP